MMVRRRCRCCCDDRGPPCEISACMVCQMVDSVPPGASVIAFGRCCTLSSQFVRCRQPAMYVHRKAMSADLSAYFRTEKIELIHTLNIELVKVHSNC